MINREVIIFFYINDIIIYYRKKNKIKTKIIIFELQIKYIINILRSLK